MSPEQVIKRVVNVLGIEQDDFYGSNFAKPAVIARYACYWHFRYVKGLFWSDVASLLGRSHSSVREGAARAEKLRADDPFFKNLSDDPFSVRLCAKTISRIRREAAKKRGSGSRVAASLEATAKRLKIMPDKPNFPLAKREAAYAAALADAAGKFEDQPCTPDTRPVRVSAKSPDVTVQSNATMVLE